MCLQILVGLGAALLSDDNHALRKKSGYRPVNLRKLMATLVIQRALKRNMRLRQSKSKLSNVEGFAEEKKAVMRRRSKTAAAQLDGEGFLDKDDDTAWCYRGSSRTSRELRENVNVGRAAESFTSTGRRDRVEAFVKGNNIPAKPALDRNPSASVGSIILPPHVDESKWLMRRFLLELQQADFEENEATVVGRRHEFSGADASNRMEGQAQIVASLTRRERELDPLPERNRAVPQQIPR